jgi:hypothetical protein
MQMINEHMNVLERMNIVEKEVQWNLKKLLIYYYETIEWMRT